MALLETDPIDWELDENNDLIIPLRYTSGIEAVAQGIRIRLQLWRGEWFLDLDAGIPYLPTEDGAVTEQAAILGQRFDSVKARTAFRREILSTPGVVDIPELRITFDGPTRTLAIEFRAKTAFGDTDLEVITLPTP
jgi:hypothetical protein